ncbi:MAG TPA: DUF4870 domain-containing protein [Humisphaera sp.]|jgi:hypothetical protein|nr:DUF4870 domain-containing protein [Humisphaera sp.]
MTQDPNIPGGTPGNVPPSGGMPPGAPLGYESVPGGYGGPPPTRDEQTMAMICHITGIFGILNWVGPLIFYTSRKDSPFIQDQSRQTLNWALTVIIGFVLGLATWCILIGIFIFIATFITNLVFCIIAAIKANQGIAYRFPFSIKFFKA